MKIHHLNCGTMCPVGQRFIEGRGGWLSQAKMICHCWLIETPHDGLVLVDTGLGLEDCADVRRRLGSMFERVIRPRADPAECAVQQVERLGFSRNDVRHIIPTHLDLDHAGGLPDFPDATVHVFRPEHDAVTAGHTHRGLERRALAHFAHGPKWRPLDVDGERWKGFEAVRTVSEDLELFLVPLPGHTRGHCGVAARQTDGWLLHAGDAYFHPDEMKSEPRCPPALAMFQRVLAEDETRRRHNQVRLRELLAAGGDVRIHCAHASIELDALDDDHAGGCAVAN